jgi:hypothetical protein
MDRSHPPVGSEGTSQSPSPLLHVPFMDKRYKIILAVVLVVVAIGLGYVIWTATRVILWSILILAVVLFILYLLFKTR